MTDHTSLHAGFEGRIPQTHDEIDEALKTGLLSLDANVLLNFYRYSPNARDAIVEVLRAAGERVWVSHQAAREFWRNRCAAIDSRNQATEQMRSAFGKNEAAAINAVESWAKQTAVPEDLKRRVVDALTSGYSEARDLIEAEVTGAGTVSYETTNDSVLTILDGLLSQHVGLPLPTEEHEKALREGSRRVEARVPPGYRDAEKGETDAEDGTSGDYLVWLQSMLEAERRALPLAIVTGDEKEDWWWKHKNTFMGPRSELVEELAERSGQKLFMLRPAQLISHASALKVAVSAGVVQDVERASSEDWDPRWSRTAVVELLKRLDQEGREQADVIRVAAEQGGVIERDHVYEVAEYDEDRMLRGFTRPTGRITRDLEAEGVVAAGVEPMLTPEYDGGVTAVRFQIPLEVVEILSVADEST